MVPMWHQNYFVIVDPQYRIISSPSLVIVSIWQCRAWCHARWYFQCVWVMGVVGDPYCQGTSIQLLIYHCRRGHSKPRASGYCTRYLPCCWVIWADACGRGCWGRSGLLCYWNIWVRICNRNHCVFKKESRLRISGWLNLDGLLSRLTTIWLPSLFFLCVFFVGHKRCWGNRGLQGQRRVYRRFVLSSNPESSSGNISCMATPNLTLVVAYGESWCCLKIEWENFLVFPEMYLGMEASQQQTL